MFRSRLYNFVKTSFRLNSKNLSYKILKIAPIPLSALKIVSCDYQKHDKEISEFDSLEHEFLIRQATTVNVNAATQLLTVTLVAIQDTSERLRDALTKEICLVKQALEWGENGTPAEHWDQLIAIRGALCDLNHNLMTLFSYMDYAEKISNLAAEISYLSGNTAASDAICERVDHANRSCSNQKKLTHDLQQESLELQKHAIINAPHLEEILKLDKLN